MELEEKNTLSLNATIYFLSVIGSVVSAIFLYFLLFGPLFTLFLWYIFFLFNRKKIYFKNWGLIHHLTLCMCVYIISLIGAYTILCIIFTTFDDINESYLILTILTIGLIGLVHSFKLMVGSTRSVKKEYSWYESIFISI